LVVPPGRSTHQDGRMKTLRAHAMRVLAEQYGIIRSSRLSTIGALIILFALVVAVLAPWLMPHDPNVSLRAADGRLAVLRPPSWEFPFGTTHLARDLLSQMIEATR